MKPLPGTRIFSGRRGNQAVKRPDQRIGDPTDQKVKFTTGVPIYTFMAQSSVAFAYRLAAETLT